MYHLHLVLWIDFIKSIIFVPIMIIISSLFRAAPDACVMAMECFVIPSAVRSTVQGIQRQCLLQHNQARLVHTFVSLRLCQMGCASLLPLALSLVFPDGHAEFFTIDLFERVFLSVAARVPITTPLSPRRSPSFAFLCWSDGGTQSSCVGAI